jgi:hypothetical protein
MESELERITIVDRLGALDQMNPARDQTNPRKVESRRCEQIPPRVSVDLEQMLRPGAD